jgi:integrase
MNNLNIEAKKRPDGRTVLLRFSYTHKGRKYFSTGVIIPEEDFDRGNLERPVKKSNPHYKRLNSSVTEVCNRIDNIRSRLILEKIAPTAGMVFHLFHDNEEVKIEEKNDPLINTLYDEFLGARTYGTATEKLYRTLFKQFDECFKAVKVSEFDQTKWIAFKTFLSEKKGHSANTLSIRLAKLKSFIRHLKKAGYEIPLKVFPMPKEEVKVISLDVTEVEAIRTFEPKTEVMKRIKDLCLFQCFTGLRISDLKRLEKCHIVDQGGQTCIKMRAYKTNKKIFIPLSNEALDILGAYDFQLPVLVEQYYNRQLKKLIQEAEIDRDHEWTAFDENGKKIIKRKKLSEIFSNHCCSRSAVSYFFDLGYSPAQVASIVGKSHDTIMTYYYGKATEAEILNKANKINPRLQIAA